ncbi:MAG: thermonuclease family protein [Clostridia bacterium]|nr:thermonuclease family protein [Clostridia bacterium]
MKKRAAVSAAALLIAAAGYIFGSIGIFTTENQALIEEIRELPAQIAQAQKAGIVPGGEIEAEVTKITDGDTIEASYKNKKYKVRLLCVDTPESEKPGVPVQPYSLEASDFMKKNVLNRKVRLIFEKEVRDRYERLLAYVVLEDGRFINAELVKNGFARVETVSPNRVNEKYFLELQSKAIAEKKGMWALPEDEQPFVKGKIGQYVPRYWSDK